MDSTESGTRILEAPEPGFFFGEKQFLCLRETFCFFFFLAFSFVRLSDFVWCIIEKVGERKTLIVISIAGLFIQGSLCFFMS